MNNMTFIRFEDRTYVIDMKAYMNFIITNTTNEKYNDTSITQIYAIDENDPSRNDLKMVTKEIGETKKNNNDTMFNIRYDFLKLLLLNVIEPNTDENGSIRRINSLSDMDFSQMLCFNTLLQEGIIKEIE